MKGGGSRSTAARAFRYWLVARSRRPSIEDLTQSALVLAPHPDDETLGCGGTIARKRRAGARVRIAFLTDGERSHPELAPTLLGRLRREEARAATQELGVAEGELTFLGLPDGELTHHRKEATVRLAELLDEVRPREVYVPHRLDGPLDHAVTTESTLAALRHVGCSVLVHEYPVWLWHGFPWVARRHEARGLLEMGPGARARCFREMRWAVPLEKALASKCRAVGRYTSQTQRLTGNGSWRTLYDVAHGEWLRALLGPHELFRRFEVHRGAWSLP